MKLAKDYDKKKLMLSFFIVKWGGRANKNSNN